MHANKLMQSRSVVESCVLFDGEFSASNIKTQKRWQLAMRCHRRPPDAMPLPSENLVRASRHQQRYWPDSLTATEPSWAAKKIAKFG